MAPRPVLDPSGIVRRIPLQPHQLTEAVTPTQQVFVLAHLGVPHVDPATWTLEIDGLVRRQRSYTLSDLKRYPKREIQSFHECAGNPLAPHIAARRIANVIWGGVDLRTLLDETGVDGTATYLWSHGVDHGAFEGVDCESYIKDLPLSRVDAGDVLVAYELNGQQLSVEHGFPVRLFIPGWYGTNSVKWLYRMTLADRRADALFTTILYNDVVAAPDGNSTPSTKPVWDIPPESVIVSPAPDEGLQMGRAVEIWGRAWAPSGIRTVEISVDDGRTWQATTVEAREQWSWQRFSCWWCPTEAGVVRLACRAVDLEGATQPQSGARNEIHAVAVTVWT